MQGACAPFDELNSRVKQICKHTALTPKDLIQRRGVEYLIHRPCAVHIWCAKSDDTMIQGAILISLLVRADRRPISIEDVMELDWKVFSELLDIISRE